MTNTDVLNRLLLSIALCALSTFLHPEEAVAECEIVMPKVRLTQSPIGAGAQQIEWNGSEYFFVFNSGPDMNTYEIRSMRVAENGNKLDENLFTQAQEYKNTCFPTWTGSVFGITWWELNNLTEKVRFTVLDSQGIKQFSEISLNPTIEGLDTQSVPSISWDGSNFAVVWAERLNDGDPYDVFMQRVSPTGDLVGGVIQVSDSTWTAYKPTVVWTGEHYLVFWVDERNNTFGEIFSAAISSDGMKLFGDIQVTNGTWAERTKWLSAACNGNECAIVWSDQDFNTTNASLSFSSTDNSGNPLNPWKIISEGSSMNNQIMPDIIWDGEHYALAWQTQSRAVNFCLLTTSGDIIYKYEPFFDCPDGCEWATVAWSGTEYGYAWTDWGYGQKDVSFTEIRCAFPRYRILRADSKAKLPASPDTVFETDALPFIDPDPVLTQGSFPDLLFYQVEPNINRIRLFKEPDTVSIHEHP
ncbi:hypothetical protein ACFLU6_14095 [Acidobacteriota bacterium]